MQKSASLGRWQLIIAILRQAFEGFLFGQSLNIIFVEWNSHGKGKSPVKEILEFEQNR
jgi:hypothetical protein